MAGSKRKADESLPTLGREFAALVIEYVKQETIEPIRGLGRYIAFGLGAVVVGSLGLVLLELGLIRLLQAQTGDAFSGHLSFIPYLCAMVVSLVAIWIAVKGTKAQPPKGEV